MPTDSSVLQAHSFFANAMNHVNGSPMKFFFNSMTFTNGRADDLGLLQASSHFVGGVCEDCIVNGGALRPSMYETALNAMAQINAVPGARFVELNTSPAAPGSAANIEQRAISNAIAWLGYSQGHTIVFKDLEDANDGLAVWPEDGIVPTLALQSMSRSAADISVAPGVWRREFRACYNQGVAIGPCAAIVNSTSRAVTVRSTWLRQAYYHVVTFRGGDVASGGQLLLTSTPFRVNSTYVPAAQGMMIAR